MAKIQGLDHAAYRCRNSEQTRQFYEDFLGLPLVEAFEIDLTQAGRATGVLHSFYQMQDGACIAFFEDPEQPFDFKPQHDFDLHLALAVDTKLCMPCSRKAVNLESTPAALPIMALSTQSIFVIPTVMWWSWRPGPIRVWPARWPPIRR